MIRPQSMSSMFPLKKAIDHFAESKLANYPKLQSKGITISRIDMHDISTSLFCFYLLLNIL